MPKVKKKLRRGEKLSFCPDCGKRFSNETNVLRHMNQPTNACGALIDADSIPGPQLVQTRAAGIQSPPRHHSRFGSPVDFGFDDLYNQTAEDVGMHSDRDAEPLSPRSDSIPDFHSRLGSPIDDVEPLRHLDLNKGSIANVEYHPRVPRVYPGGKTFMDDFFSDKYGSLRRENLFYPFASRDDWQLGSWLLRSGLSMAAINDFLSLDLIKTLPISFRSARQLRQRAEMLPSGPCWKSLTIRPSVPTKRTVSLYYRDPLECLQALLSHPLFERRISFIPRKVWSTAARLVRVYDDWLSGDHAWELQDALPEGATLLGVTLSSDKTNISVVSGNRMAHPLLISLANLDPEIRCKGSLHGHLLLALLPVPSFIHKQSRVRGLLSDRLFHQCLDIVLRPLKVAASVGVMMSDPVGNLRYCYTPLVVHTADTPEQGLVACTSTRASSISKAFHHQFGDNIRYPYRTAEQTIGEIREICSKCHSEDFVKFLKYAKSYGLNGVDVPFWIDWPLSVPAKFLKPEVLHHFHRFFFDHDLQWCIIAIGDAEIDYRFTLIQTLVGYRAFKEGVSKLKQVTGRDHRSMQRYIVGVIAGAVPQRFLTAISALLDFRYLAQMSFFDDQTLQKLDDALRRFHDHKDAIIAAGGRSEHFNIPKLELLQHVVPSIRESGAVMQWSADVTEHAHVTEVKNPARAGNNQNYYAQIARHLDRADKCFRFDLATRIATLEHQPQDDDEGEEGEGEEENDEEHEPSEELQNSLLYNSPTRNIMDYFQIASALHNSAAPGNILPPSTFASSTTAIHLACKPTLTMTLSQASESFGLSDLRSALLACLDRCSSGEAHDVAGRRQATYHSTFPSDKLQIWTKVRVQLRTWGAPESVEPPQTLIVAPPSPQYSHGRYDCAIVSQTADSNWPSGGLNGHLVVQLCLVFRVLGIDTSFAYVQRFHVGTVDAGSGLHPLKRATRRDGSRIGDVIPLSHVRSPAQIIPRFGRAANSHLNANTSYELSSDFWLNKYWNKQFYYSLTL